MSSTQQRLATWRQLLAEQQASGQSVAHWCRQRDISATTFYNWRKRLADAPFTSSAPQWLAVTASTEYYPLVLRIGRIAVEVTVGFDPRLLHDVLAVLEAR